MSKTVYRSVTPKRRSARPKARASAAAPYQGMLVRLAGASAVLRAARGRR